MSAKCRQKIKEQYFKTALETSINKKSFSVEKLLVRIIGLEPTRLAAPDPKSGMSTNFTISACNCGANIHKFFNCKTFF